MIDNDKRFNMNRRPSRPLPILKPIVWGVSLPQARKHGAIIHKFGMPDHLKPPYLLLCNHNSFMDFYVMTKAIFPHRANYVVAIDGFLGMEGLLRAVGGIGTRKFTNSISLIKNMFRVCNRGDICVMFPEARYSLCGTQSVLPASLGKIITKMNVPVVTLIMHGHHVNSPFWNVGNRGVKPVEADMKLLFTAEEAKTLPVAEINQRLAEAFEYDDFAWQLQKRIRINKKKRAEGLHKVLYQCPACNTEYQMTSEKAQLHCQACGKSWEMTPLGELRAKKGETEFSHIPDWYEWERANVRQEIEAGTYSFESEVRVESLPNAKKFIVFDEPGYLTHNMDGFSLSGVSKTGPFSLDWSVPSLYSCHVEYNYMKRGDCIDLNTNEDTLYLFPQAEEFSVTKIALATEELYTHAKKKAPK
jgi:transcription elongation factor Elf1